MIATALVAITLLIASLLILSLVERDVREVAQDAVAAALAQQAARFDDSSRFGLVRGNDTFEFGVFEESGELAFGKLFVAGDLAGEVEVNLTTGQINELLDPVTVLTLADPELRAELEALTFLFLDVDGDDGSRLLAGATSQDELDISTSAVRRALLITVPAVVLAFVLLTWWLVGRALRSVDAITDRVNEISTTSLGERVPVPATGDEVARLATMMNRMLERLEQGDERQRRFAADASHELRTPLATVRAAAEVIESSPAEGTAADLAGDIVAEVDRMDDLIGDLLDLARFEAGVADAAATIDLGELVQSVLVDSAVRIRIDDDAIVVGDPTQLAGMVRNLVENAKRHARSEVRLSVERTDDSVLLSVEDDGPGVAAADREVVFERFARLDEGRARDGGGTGLGLALVKLIAERHSGTVGVDRSSELGGASFMVELPLVR